MKTLIIKALAYCTIIIVGTACQTSPQDTTKADEDAVKALIELWDINDIKGDADLMASLYTDNAIMLGGFDGGLIRGNEQFNSILQVRTKKMYPRLLIPVSMKSGFLEILHTYVEVGPLPLQMVRVLVGIGSKYMNANPIMNGLSLSRYGM